MSTSSAMLPPQPLTQTWADYKDMVARGLLKPEIAVGWYFDMPIETEADLKKVREKYMPEIQAMEGAGDE